MSNEFSKPTNVHPRFPEADRLIKQIPASKLEENRRKLKTGFKLFQVSNAESTLVKIFLRVKKYDKMYNRDIQR